MPNAVLRLCLVALAVAPLISSPARCQTMPRIEKRDGRFSMVVDGKPYLMLGAQINNSSSWPGALQDVWPALKDLHANTVEAPVYWEQMEAEKGKFDFANVDLLIHGGAGASSAAGAAVVWNVEERSEPLCSGVG